MRWPQTYQLDRGNLSVLFDAMRLLRLILLFFWVGASPLLTAQSASQTTPLSNIESRIDTSSLDADRFVVPKNPKTLPFLDTSVNLIQSFQVSNIASILSIYEKRNVGHSIPEEPVGVRPTIMHIGDEQVAQMSSAFHKGLMGASATPGLFFPSTLANQSIPSDIVTSHTGLWTYATPSESNRLLNAGITGYVAQTTESGSSITIKIPAHYQRTSDRFRLYCERSEQNMDIIITTCAGRKSDGSPISPVKREFKSGPEYKNLIEVIEMSISPGTKEILITCKKNHSLQQRFTLWGTSLTHSGSMQFHSIGMRGSGYSDLLRLEQFFEQLPYFTPDIILLDFGLYENYRAAENESIYLKPLNLCLAKIKAYAPTAKIVICIPQDCIRGGRTLQTFEKFEQAVISLCKTEKCAYYDWYRVSGGKYSAQYWADYHLFKPDGLHLEDAGEQLKSLCYVSAFSQTQNRYANGYRQFYIAPDSSKRLAFRTRDTLTKNIIVSEVWRYHVVRRGETAYRIALRYGITVAQLKEWNHLRNYNIAAGTRLKVGKIAIATKSDPIQPVSMKDSTESELTGDITPINGRNDSLNVVTERPKNNKPPVANDTPKVKYHKVRAGETLYSISKAYGMDVETLKRLNGLRNNNLAVGRLLRVR